MSEVERVKSHCHVMLRCRVGAELGSRTLAEIDIFDDPAASGLCLFINEMPLGTEKRPG